MGTFFTMPLEKGTQTSGKLTPMIKIRLELEETAVLMSIINIGLLLRHSSMNV